LFWFFRFAIWVRCIPPCPPRGERGGGQKLPSRLQHILVCRTGSLCLPVWSMAPLPLCNEYQFPQLGPHWIEQSNCYSLDPQRRVAITAIGQFQSGHWFNANQFPQYNEGNSISRIGQSRD